MLRGAIKVGEAPGADLMITLAAAAACAFRLILPALQEEKYAGNQSDLISALISGVDIAYFAL